MEVTTKTAPRIQVALWSTVTLPRGPKAVCEAPPEGRGYIHVPPALQQNQQDQQNAGQNVNAR